MRHRTLTAARTLAAAALVAALALSCPNPIDEELLLVVDDALSPDLAIATPTPNSWYHGTMTVSGILADSSSEVGDGFGRLASLSFSVSDYSPLARTVTFDADGNATVTPADPTFSWDPASGGFSFDFPSDGLFGYKVLTFVATDLNGNEVRKDLPLLPYPYGPYVVLDEPVDLSTYDMVVAIAGTVTDASGDPTADEVKALRWRASGEPDCDLVIGPATLQPDGTYRNGNFTFNPVTGAFSDWFDSSNNSGTVIVKVSALNATMWTEVTSSLVFNGAGPDITLASAGAGHNPTEYSSVVTPTITVDGTVDMTNYSAGSLRYLVKQQPGLPQSGLISPDPSTGAFSFTFDPDGSPVLAGNLTIEVSAKDNRVPPIESTASYACYDDQSPPGAPVVSGPATPTSDGTPRWTWTTPATTVDFEYSTVGSSGPWTATTDTYWEPATPLSEGAHTLWVRARDPVGNPSAAGSYALTVDTNPPAAPSVTGPTTPTNDTTPTWTWTTPAGTVEFHYSFVSTTGPWTVTPDTSYTPTLGAGSHELWVQGRDAAGNWSGSSSASVTVDLTPPSAPGLTGPVTPTNDTTPTWSWTTPADTVEFRWSMTSATGPWTTTVLTLYTPTLGAGSHELWVQGRDAAGNWSASASASVVIDVSAPDTPVVTGPATPTNDTTPTWSWTTPADTVEFRYSLSSTTGPWTTTVLTLYTPTLGAGSHQLWVQGRDAAGNWSGSDSASVDIDLSPPAAPNVTGPTRRRTIRRRRGRGLRPRIRWSSGTRSRATRGRGPPRTTRSTPRRSGKDPIRCGCRDATRWATGRLPTARG